MKTKVYLPDDLFRLAEAAARRLRVSRSELYDLALAEFLQSRQEDAVTRHLDDLYYRRIEKVPADFHHAQLKF